MTDPPRLRARYAGHLEARLLDSARGDKPGRHTRARTLAALGVGVGVEASALGAAPSAAASTKLVSTAGVVLFAKTIGVGAAVVVSALAAREVLPGAIGVLARRPVPAQATSPMAGARPPGRMEGETPHRDPAVETRAPALGPVDRPSAARSAPAVQSAAVAPAWSTSGPHSEPSTVTPPSRPVPTESAPLRSGIADELAPKSAPPPSRLADELATLEGVRAALAAGDAARAVALLDAYEHSFPRGELSPEATVLRIQALLRSHDREAAQRVARRFVEEFPTSTHVSDLRRLLGGVGE